VQAPPGPFFGIPYPGTFILDRNGVVVQKYFEDDFKQRYTASDILAKQYNAETGEARSTIEAKHLRLSASAGVSAVHVGQRIALDLDIDLPRDVHVYAPGVQGYIPIDFAITASDAVKPLPAVYPASKTMHLKAINETVPVYTGHFRILREVTIGASLPEGQLTIEGSFRYQACDSRECFIPETVPLKWVLQVEPLDRERPPADIQHK
jgi:cytochrome c biogenesis DsbD-like protein